LTVKKAYLSFGILITIGLGCGYLLDISFFAIQAAYVIMNIAYTFKLEQIVILDVMCIAIGFLFRVLAGTALAAVRPSDWLIICTITLSLFLGFSKRRHELLLMGPNANDHRKVLTRIAQHFLTR
jgi:4-hydroxybenzoate polyprenyltransferase